jgi:hypothetical protein
MTDELLRERWRAVSEHLAAMTAAVAAAQDGRVDLMRFAEGYAALSRAYLAALMQQGKTSMRVECVVKALDLKTPKSALEKFLGRV